MEPPIDRWLTRIAASYTLALLILLCIPIPDIEALPKESNYDKVAHMLLFVGLGLVWALAFQRRSRGHVQAATIGILISLATEILQGFLPWRTADVFDVACNIIGVGIGLACHRFIRSVRRSESSP